MQRAKTRAGNTDGSFHVFGWRAQNYRKAATNLVDRSTQCPAAPLAIAIGVDKIASRCIGIAILEIGKCFACGEHLPGQPLVKRVPFAMVKTARHEITLRGKFAEKPALMARRA